MENLINMIYSLMLAGTFGLWKKNYWAFLFMLIVCYLIFDLFMGI
ncbi:MAG TPA: hypothetical protein VJ438_06300 [Candidatus Nanoarchaeia archaeon]|nr:hypothetical protein [Candidatus Nanoarchaeia archaeon]